MKKRSWLLIFLLTITITNYPNPFNPKGGEIATFECRTDASLETTIYLYDMSARLIMQKIFNVQSGRVNLTSWNGYSEANEIVSNGIYLYRLIDNSTKKSVGKGKVWVINR
jgi:hypothetical protein